MTNNRKELKKALDSLFLSVASSIAWDVQQKVDAVIAELELALKIQEASRKSHYECEDRMVALLDNKTEQIARLTAAGDQLMRAVEYTSGTSLEFAVKEWKAARNEQ